MTHSNAWQELLASIDSRYRERLAELFDFQDADFARLARSAMEEEAEQKRKPRTSLLLESGLLVRAVAHPSLLDGVTALQLTRLAAGFNQFLDRDLLTHVSLSESEGHIEAPREQVLRVLELVDGISDCRRLVVALQRFLRYRDPHIRSKAVKLRARGVQNKYWFHTAFQQVDPRVRSNLLEGMAGRSDVPVSELTELLQVAARDPHHRIATTALYLLAREGDNASRLTLERMLQHESSEFRKAANWALQKLLEKPEQPSGMVQQEVSQAKD